MIELRRWEEFQELVQIRNSFILFKHSNRCGISSRAHSEISRYALLENVLKVYWLDVIGSRKLSQEIAASLQVHHQSPQVIIIQQGQVTKVMSHYAIKAEEILNQHQPSE